MVRFLKFNYTETDLNTINIKNNNFLSFKLILNLNFVIKKKDIIKKGNSIPICFTININGNIK